MSIGRGGLLLIVAVLLSLGVRATHIIGGDVSMQAVGKTPGLFRLQLNQYWDEVKTGTGNRDGSVKLLIFRKQNPVLIESVELDLQETLPLTFDNAACAMLRQLNFTEARYYKTHQFDPKLYTDPGGYYIVWERCCRNDDLTNVNSAIPAGLAMVFYLEFPPMLKNGATFQNSSPDFRVPNGDYICINKPFTFNAGATDADGDQLRYSLVTPLNGYTNRTTPLMLTDIARTSYPPITWATGYSVATSIPGNPPLSINPNTGQLTVRANREGLFLFTVQCEELRNGERIGVVRRDFQLPVVDCSKNTPPPAVVMANGKTASELVWCGSQPLVLSIEKDPLWAYQWQKDGENLRGAITDTLQVRATGVYTVVKSQANACASDTTSQAVKVQYVTAPPVKLTVTAPQPYCAGDTVTLRAEGQPGYQYRWRRDQKELTGEQQATLRVVQSGQYDVLARPKEAVCEGQDSLRVRFNPRPSAQLNASAQTFCPDESVQLTAENGTGYSFVWQQDGNKLGETTNPLTVRQGGTYRVTITAPTGCSATSNSVTLTQHDRPAALLDSIAAVCVSSNSVLTLGGQPAGGVYAGPGVHGNRFDPARAGVGRHQITYTVTSDNGCRAEQSRWAVVSAGLTLTGKTSYQIVKGASVELTTQSSEPISRYHWDPPASLNRTDVANPLASPLETTPYQLTAVGAGGCWSTLSILVEVTEPMYVPSAFSPNADGQNDVWIIPNITSFPQCEVSVFNRWGELLFSSRGYTQPWDGTYQTEPVPAGLYTYQIRTGSGPLSATYRGQLMVIH
ncbi:gliding motility-associated C-terminal domain-containing protein [Spirosoma areae]